MGFVRFCFPLKNAHGDAMFNSSTKGIIIQNHKNGKLEDKDTKDKDYLVGNGTWSLQYQDRPDSLLTRVWQKLTPEVVVELLIEAASRPRYNPDGPSTAYLAGQMLREMRHLAWVIEGAPHAGGQNGSTSRDSNLHARVRVIKVRCGSTRNFAEARHLVLKEEPRLHIIDISDREPDVCWIPPPELEE
ncbi:hypothetical protein [Cystobacter fuscus]|uniref:hypothetical protein n=1 Tax=Cystobacter fuscus TaxID=43 RepID=UPI0012DDB935|nr:hypothetical protein [Cystobacter fuscus]